MKTLGKKIKDFGFHFKVKNSFWKRRNDYGVLSIDSHKAGYWERKGRRRYRDHEFPKGCFAVYVGEERRRFVIPAIYLSHPIFRMLLDKAREEYGFKQREGLMLPFDVEAFEQSLWLIRRSRSASGQFNLEKLVNQFLLKPSLTPYE